MKPETCSTSELLQCRSQAEAAHELSSCGIASLSHNGTSAGKEMLLCLEQISQCFTVLHHSLGCLCLLAAVLQRSSCLLQLSAGHLSASYRPLHTRDLTSSSTAGGRWAENVFDMLLLGAFPVWKNGPDHSPIHYTAVTDASNMDILHWNEQSRNQNRCETSAL